MSLSYQQSNFSFNDATSLSISVTLTGVSAGSLLVVWICWENYGNGSSDISISSVSDGTNSFTIGSQNLRGDGSSGEPCGHFAWLLSADSGDITIDVTMASSVTHLFAAAFEFAPGSSETVSKVAEDATAEGSDANPTSGAISASTGDAVIAGTQFWTNSGSWTGWDIGGLTADGHEESADSLDDYATAWCKILSSSLSSDDAEVIRDGGSSDWVCSIIAFEAAAGGTTVTVDSISQSQGMDAPTLSQLSTLSLNDIAQSQSIDPITVSQIHQLATNAISQAQSLDGPTIDQIISLAINAVSQGQEIDSPTISQIHQLAVNALSQGQSLGGITLDQLSTLSIDEVDQAQTLDAPSISVAGEFVINSIAQGQSLDAPSLSQYQGALTLATITQGQTLGSLALDQAHSIVCNNIAQGQSIDTQALDQLISLSIDAVTQGQTLDEPSFFAVSVLDIDNVSQAQSIKATSISQVSQLIIDQVSQGQDIENVNFSIAEGRIYITISVRLPGVNINGRSPGVNFNGRQPNIKFH